MLIMMMMTEFIHFPDFGEKGTTYPQEGFSTPIYENLPLGIPGIPVWAPSGIWLGRRFRTDWLPRCPGPPSEGHQATGWAATAAWDT